jgi:hypothetical protein
MPPRDSTEADARQRRRDRRILLLIALAGVVLTVIGVRFLVVPEQASRTFGVLVRPSGFQWQAVVALRDVWLGLLALGLVWLGEWRALTLWLGLGSLVCFGDAGIVLGASNSGRLGPFLFHVASGVFCAVLAVLAWRRSCRIPAAWHPAEVVERH